MIELRADGSIPGKPQRGRVYKMAGEGKVWFSLWTGEFDTDLKSYIALYPEFRGWQTDFLPLSEAKVQFESIKAAGVSKDELAVENVRHLKSEFMKARDVAEKAAFAYFNACPVGDERNWASDIYENIRKSAWVYKS